MGFFDKIFNRNKVQEEAKETLDKGLEKTKESFFSKIGKSLVGKSVVDEEILDEVEEALIRADVGVKTTVAIIDNIEARVAKDKYIGTENLNQILQEEMANVLVDAPSLEYQNLICPPIKNPTLF